MNNVYPLGALPSLPDERDYSVCAIPRAFAEEYIIDMDKSYHQQCGTCVSQSHRGVFRKRFGIEFGTAFQYGGGRSHSMPGLYPNEAANFACKYGLAPATDDPTEIEVTEVMDYYAANRQRLEKAAAPYAGGKWGRAHDINAIKAALVDGLPVMFCAAIEQWNPDKFYRYPCKNATQGYHEMLVIGWQRVQGEEMAVVYNSWGTEWGFDGKCFMWWEDVLRMNDVIILTPPERNENKEDNIVVRRTLRAGMSGKDVEELQRLLVAYGYIIPEINGIFDGTTEIAVRMFQGNQDLKVDGVVGPKTWAELDMGEYDSPNRDDFTPTGLMATFISYLEEQYANHGIYVWGAQGEMTITEAWIKKAETSSANAKRAIDYWHKQVAAGYGDVLRAFDCSGLGMYFIQGLYGLTKSDRSAQGMRALCKEIDRDDLRAGDWVFRINDKGVATHIGYVVDNDKRIIHARGRDYGIRSEYLNDNGATYWNGYGRPTVFDEPNRDLKLTDPLMRGDDVLALQETLLFLGYDSIGKADGVYGERTDAALRSFQGRAKTMTDGVCDEVMHKLLGL